MMQFLYLLTLCIIFPAHAIEVENAPNKESYSDCKNCHTKKAERSYSFNAGKKREHQKITLFHGHKAMSCNLCHDKANGNNLTNGLGDVVTFKNPSKTCQICHADIFKSWDQGLHGKMKSGWANKTRTNSQCIICHDSHNVSFKQMRAFKAPHRPKLSIKKID